MSVDFRLMFLYHVSMMMLMLAGGSGISLLQELLVAACLIVGILAFSWKYRVKHRWRWPGASVKNVLAAAGGTLLMVLFLYAATPLFPPSNPQGAPWYLAGLGIGVFSILLSLRIATYSQAEFLSQCLELDLYGREVPRLPDTAASPVPREAPWKKVARGLFSLLFLAIWLTGIGFFYYFGKTFNSGSPEPTIEKTAPLTDHGKTVYVRPADKRRIELLETTMMVGVPTCLLLMGFLHFVAGVKLFPNTPTLAEWLANRRGPPINPV